MLIVKTRFTLFIKVYASLTVPRGQCEQEIDHGLVLEISGRRRLRQRRRRSVSQNKKRGSGCFRGPFSLSSFRPRRRRRPRPAPQRAGMKMARPPSSLPPEICSHRRIRANPRANPQKGWRGAPRSCISRDETNQIIDELSPRSVIYRLASSRRRGTIGGGSTTGAPQEIVSGCKWRISVVHSIWTRANPSCAQKKCPGDRFRC